MLAALDRLNLAGNTLLIVTSDNGGILDNNGPDMEHGIGAPDANEGHLFNGPLRGTKSTAYEGGTRVPFIARWPGRVPPGDSSALISHVDMIASFAALTGQKLVDAAGPDSFDVLPALLGEKTGREYLVEHGNVLSLRKGQWKLVPVGGGKKGKRGSAQKAELYNLADDLGETKDVAVQHPEIVKEMTAMLEQIREKGRSR